MPHEAGHHDEDQEVIRQPIGPGERVAIGWPVCTSDGEELGTVKEVKGGYFKVNAPMAPDYWLQSQFIVMQEADKLRLEFDKDRLDDYKLGDPSDLRPGGDVIAEGEAPPPGGYPESAAAATIRESERQQRA